MYGNYGNYSGYAGSAYGGYAAYGAFGVTASVPWEFGTANVDSSRAYAYCGSKYGIQTMLRDLGFYTGVVDGKIGPASQRAILSFAKARGISLVGGMTPAYCEALITAWKAKMQPPPKPRPEPTPEPTPEPAPTEHVELPPENGEPPPTPPTKKPGLSTGAKVAIGVGAAVVLAGVLYMVLKKPGYKSNPATTKRQRVAQMTARKRIKGKRGRAATGKIVTLPSGRRYGHLKPPKEYWGQGARRKSDYAWPAGYGYPLVFRTKTGKVKPQRTRSAIRAAARYFGKNKDRYPPKVRGTIARNINQAKKRYGIGGEPASPSLSK